MIESTVISLMTPWKPRPLIITSRIASINHFAGMSCAMAWSGSGILSMGNIKPESNMVGNMRPITEMSKATNPDKIHNGMDNLYW